MSTEVTPDLLRRVAAAWEGGSASDDYARNELRARADHLEREQRPLPTEPGWYPGIVVERGGESCTGALLTDGEYWETCQRVGGRRTHNSWEPGTTVRWAEQDGKTPGQTLYEATDPQLGKWSANTSGFRGRFEQRAAAVLAAHGTPTLTEWKCPSCGETTRARMADQDAPTLNPVGEHPESGTRGLLPLVSTGVEWRTYADADLPTYICGVRARMASAILADPRPDGAHE